MGMSTVASIVRTHGRDRPEQPAITLDDRTTSWGDLDARSSRIANGLAAAGVGAEDRVALIDKNGPEYFEILFGSAKLNAVTVAVNWRLAPLEMAQIIRDAEAKVLFVAPEFLAHLDKIEEDLTSVAKIVIIGDHARHDGYEAWLAAHAPEDPGVEADEHDVAMQLYTSGTTGLPKGVMITHANLFGFVENISSVWGFAPETVTLVAMPLFHIGGSGWATVGLWNGCHSVILREVVPAEILRLIETYRVNSTFFVPAVLQFLLATPGVDETDFSSLKMILYGASPITDDVLLKCLSTFGCEFVQVYGLTETTGAVVQLDAADHRPVERPDLLRSCGKPYSWVELRTVDAETEEDTPPGKVGEVWIRSFQNMKGYWNKPDETAKTKTADNWVKTGDAGYLDAEGFLFLYDRVKDMIVSGGENIYPAEVENALMSHPDVADVAVIGVPDDRWGETVKAVIVREPGSDPRPDDIITWARERLAGFKLPRSVDFVDVLPRNPSGKLLKRELRDPYWEGRERRVN